MRGSNLVEQIKDVARSGAVDGWNATVDSVKGMLDKASDSSSKTSKAVVDDSYKQKEGEFREEGGECAVVEPSPRVEGTEPEEGS